MNKTADQLLAEAREQLPHRLSPAEAVQAVANGALLIDIRGDDQIRSDGSIPGAVVVPRNVLEWRCDPGSEWRLPVIHSHGQRVILICNEGYQSSLAAANLQQLGFRQATDVDGGFVAWEQAGCPVISATSRHWDAVYERAGIDGVSWHQREPRMSLALIERLSVPQDAAVIDVGGGASELCATLHARGYSDLTVLDTSARALEAVQQRFDGARPPIQFLLRDVLAWSPARNYDLWHDRALFHFFVDLVQRARYLDVLRAALRPGGHAIVGTFAADGPQRCSGLPVARYGPEQLAASLGPGFTTVESQREEHHTPKGVAQPFTWVVLRRDS